MNSQQDDELTANKIAALLDQATRDIPTPTAAKLLEARKEALAHYKDSPQRAMAPAWAPAWATTLGDRVGSSYGMRMTLILLTFLTMIASVIVWHNATQPTSEMADIDSALLTDELPINALLDKGFDSWLKRQ
jgi:hypothetical protein